MYLSAESSVEITIYTKRRREQEDVSNRQDNDLSKAYIRRQIKREKSLIDECTSRDLEDKI